MDDFISYLMKQMEGKVIIDKRLRGGVGLGPELTSQIRTCFLTPSKVEVYQSRAYRPGDELRHIDWKSYARTDKLHVTESLTEEKAAFYVFFDEEVLESPLVGENDFEFVKLALFLCFVAFSKGGKVILFGVRKQEDGLVVGKMASGSNFGQFLPSLVEFFKLDKPKPGSIPVSNFFSRITEHKPFLFFIGLFFHKDFLPLIFGARKRWVTSAFFPRAAALQAGADFVVRGDDGSEGNSIFCSEYAKRLLLVETFRYFQELSGNLQRAGIPFGVLLNWKTSYEVLVGFFEQYGKYFSNN